MSSILAIVTLLAFVTYDNRNITSASPFLLFAIQNHLWIMFVLVVVSVAFGFYGAYFLVGEIEAKTKASEDTVKLLFQVLQKGERIILNHLCDNKGLARQADLSKLPDMTRVKAHRCLKKLKEMNLVQIIEKGKIKTVKVDDALMNAVEGRNRPE